MRIFCKCGAPTKHKGKHYKCLKTEQIIDTCDGIWHGDDESRTFMRKVKQNE